MAVLTIIARQKEDCRRYCWGEAVQWGKIFLLGPVGDTGPHLSYSDRKIIESVQLHLASSCFDFYFPLVLLSLREKGLGQPGCVVTNSMEDGPLGYNTKPYGQSVPAFLGLFQYSEGIPQEFAITGPAQQKQKNVAP